jgi:phage head maturation protease
MDTSKAKFTSSESGIRFYCPIEKLEKQPDGTVWAMGWGSVSDYRDDQNEIVDPIAMREAVAEWAPWGNIRLQHDSSRPIGVCPEGNWEIRAHPETGTDALWLNAHIVEPTAIKMLEEGVLKGFSIGGVCLERSPENVTVEDGSEARAYRLKRFKLSEISLVDEPACDLATVERVELAKRSVEEEIAMNGSFDPASQPLRLGADEAGVLRKFLSRLFGRQAETFREAAARHGARSRTESIDGHEGRPAAERKGESRPAGTGGGAAGQSLAKSLGAIAFLVQKLAAWDADIEAMKAVASALNYEAIQEGDDSDASERMLEVIEEFRQVRDRVGELMAEIAKEEAGEIAEGTEEENDAIMNAAKVLKAINEAVREDEVRKSDGAGDSANSASLARCGAHLGKAAHHHEQLGVHLDALHKCYKAAGAGIDEAAEHLAQAREHHEALGEHQELARLHSGKAVSASAAAGSPESSTEDSPITDLTLDQIIASALGTGNLRKRDGARIFSEIIALIRKNAELEARLASLDNTPVRPKARLFAVHKGDETRALIEQAGDRSSESGERIDPADRDAFGKAYRNIFARPRSIRDPMFKGSAGGSL